MRRTRKKKRPVAKLIRIHLIDGVGVPVAVHRQRQAFGEYANARFEIAERWSTK